MKERLISVFTIGGLLLIIAALCVYISGIDDRRAEAVATTVPVAESTTFVNVMTTAVPDVYVPENTTATVPAVTENTTDAVATTVPVSVSAEEEEKLPVAKNEIIDKYSELVNDFKAQRPAYKTKEFQQMPEEYRDFGAAGNIVLKFASNYMVSEEDCEVFVRDAGAEEILVDLPIRDSEKACVLTDYDAVTWAKCEELSDGTVKLSFSLKEERNVEPTPPDTLIPTSAHGAVMHPVPIADIMNEINEVQSALPGVTLNEFSLIYKDCVFECVYNPETNQLLSLTQNLSIDIVADLVLLGSNINGSAKLIHKLLVYDVIW